jgi:hypothetical protein
MTCGRPLAKGADVGAAVAGAPATGMRVNCHDGESGTRRTMREPSPSAGGRGCASAVTRAMQHKLKCARGSSPILGDLAFRIQPVD